MARIPASHKCKGTRYWEHTFPSGIVTHGYDIEGACAPTVTGVLKVLGKGDGLLYWAGQEAAKCSIDDPDVALMDREAYIKWVSGAHQRSKDAAAQVGTHVHHWAETGEIPDEMTEDIEAMIGQYRLWFQRFKPKVLLLERPVFSLTRCYGGRFDMIATIEGYGDLIIDLKTGGRKTGAFYPEHPLQQAAYRYADFYHDETGEAQPMPKVDGAAILHVRPDFFEFAPLECGPAEFDAFCHLRKMYDWWNGWKAPSAVEAPLYPYDDGDPFANLGDAKEASR